MFRRRFLQWMTLATAGSIAPLEAMAAGARKIVTYRVKGFSCITCATGLDTMLGQQKGIVSSKSTYPDGQVTVGFNPEQITEKAIVAFITDLGFTVESEHKGGDSLPAGRLPHGKR
jgi:copper chaperone CopZ